MTKNEEGNDIYHPRDVKNNENKRGVAKISREPKINQKTKY